MSDKLDKTDKAEKLEELDETTDCKKFKWKNEQEDILKNWADKALCYKAMHDRAYKKYWCLNAWFNIPVIILST